MGKVETEEEDVLPFPCSLTLEHMVFQSGTEEWDEGEESQALD